MGEPCEHCGEWVDTRLRAENERLSLDLDIAQDRVGVLTEALERIASINEGASSRARTILKGQP